MLKLFKQRITFYFIEYKVPYTFDAKKIYGATTAKQSSKTQS